MCCLVRFTGTYEVLDLYNLLPPILVSEYRKKGKPMVRAANKYFRTEIAILCQIQHSVAIMCYIPNLENSMFFLLGICTSLPDHSMRSMFQHYHSRRRYCHWHGRIEIVGCVAIAWPEMVTKDHKDSEVLCIKSTLRFSSPFSCWSRIQRTGHQIGSFDHD